MNPKKETDMVEKNWREDLLEQVLAKCNNLEQRIAALEAPKKNPLCIVNPKLKGAPSAEDRAKGHATLIRRAKERRAAFTDFLGKLPIAIWGSASEAARRYEMTGGKISYAVAREVYKSLGGA